MTLLTKVKAAAVGVVAVGALVGPTAATAEAATPRCVAHNYVYVVSGGCDGVGGRGLHRMVIRCRVNNSAFWVDWRLGWHDRYSSWQQTAACGGGWHVWQVWFEHTNS